VIIAQVLLQQSLGSLMFSSLGVLLPSMEAELRFGTAEAGWLGAGRTLGQLLVFPASILLVRYAPYRLFNLLALVLASALWLGGLAPNYWVVLAGLAIYSLGSFFGQIPANLVRLQWIPPRQFASVMGANLALNTILQSLGLALVPLILAAVGGWRTIFLGNGVLLFSVAVVWFLTARERITARYQAAQAQDRGLSAAGSVVRRREFFLLGLAVLGGASAFTTTLLLLPSYFVHERGFSLQTAGSITAVIPLGGLVVNLTAGYISDRIGLRKPLIWPSGVLLPPLYWLMLSPLPPWALVIVGALLGGFVYLPFPSLQTMPFEIPGLTPAEVAIGQSLMNTVSTIGILLGPVVASQIAAYSDSYRIGLLSLSFLPTSFLWVCFSLPETGPKVRRKAV
jgi:predicted MFS family arabinose efflux permease